MAHAGFWEPNSVRDTWNRRRGDGDINHYSGRQYWLYTYGLYTGDRSHIGSSIGREHIWSIGAGWKSIRSNYSDLPTDDGAELCILAEHVHMERSRRSIILCYHVGSYSTSCMAII